MARGRAEEYFVHEYGIYGTFEAMKQIVNDAFL